VNFHLYLNVIPGSAPAVPIPNTPSVAVVNSKSNKLNKTHLSLPLECQVWVLGGGGGFMELIQRLLFQTKPLSRSLSPSIVFLFLAYFAKCSCNCSFSLTPSSDFQYIVSLSIWIRLLSLSRCFHRCYFHNDFCAP
jgi:hypothetical protein